MTAIALVGVLPPEIQTLEKVSKMQLKLLCGECGEIPRLPTPALLRRRVGLLSRIHAGVESQLAEIGYAVQYPHTNTPMSLNSATCI